MLGLGEKVGGAVHGVRRVVSHQHRLRGSVKSVDGDLAEDHSFCQGDEEIAGAAYHVDFTDGFCAVGHCSNGLGSADAEDAVDAGDGGGGHDCGRSRRGAQNDFFDAGNAGGNGRHKHCLRGRRRCRRGRRLQRAAWE